MAKKLIGYDVIIPFDSREAAEECLAEIKKEFYYGGHIRSAYQDDNEEVEEV